MDWLETTIDTTPEKLDELLTRLDDLGIEGFVINDEASVRTFLDSNPTAWDFVEDEVFAALRGRSNVQFYVEDSPEGLARIEEYRKALPGSALTVRLVNDEDWLNNWKAFFKPTEIGSRLLIVPEWEPVPENTDRVILRIEPKNAFGTGAHASTKMCLEELEIHNPEKVLDLGSGSGILAVASLLMGARSAIACDLSTDAEAVCRDNARLNSINENRLQVYTGNILDPSLLAEITGGARYDAVFANIIADVIIALAPRVPGLLTPGGVFICSGIIDGREDEVRRALTDSGLRIVSTRKTDNWHMLAAVIK
jgi:ribosomal protein L11 methyltransferase